MVAPDEREFVTFARGEIRDNILLASFRNSLRSLLDPDTGAPFTEDKIARATQPGSRFYIEADAIDIVGMAFQKRGLYLSDQLDPRRANSQLLKELWGQRWVGDKLAAVGASGSIGGTGTAGTLVPGSTTIGDPTAAVATDPNGQRFQVLVSELVESDGTVSLQVKGIDTGSSTNIPVGTTMTWVSPPLGLDPEASIIAAPDTGFGLTGGFDEESDQEYAIRIENQILNKPASGNNAHFQAWAKEATSAVEQGFVYATALYAGSTLVAPTQRRSAAGPLARLPTAATLLDTTGYLVPPNSPVVPQRAFVLVVPITAQSTDFVLRISMSQGLAGGWADVDPWPNVAVPLGVASTTEEVQVATVASQTSFTIETPTLLPGQTIGVPSTLSGDDAPAIMIWNDGTSRFEQLDVSQVQHDGSTTATVTLNTAPTKTITIGDRISPYTDRLTIIAEAIEEFFDTLGPGELVTSTDTRFSRAARDPRPSLQFPIRAGQAVISTVVDALGGVASDAELTRISRQEPDLPANVTDGPNMVTIGKVNIYPL